MLALSLFALLATGQVSVSAVPSAADLMSRVEAAKKTHRPHSVTEDWDLTQESMSGHKHVARRGDDDVQVTVLGPFTTSSGTVGGKSWHQNENGYTIVTGSSPEERLASDSPVVNRVVRRVRAPVDAYVIETHRINGVIERDYYAPSDYLLLRQEYEFKGLVNHFDYTDIRRDNYGRRAWRVEGVFAKSTNKLDERLVRVTENPQLDDATFAIPPTRGTLVEFPPGVDTVRISDSIDTHIYVTVNINGHDLTFILDSGAGGILIDTQAAKELGLPMYGKATQYVAGTFQRSRTIAPVIQVGDITMHNVAMFTGPLDFHEGSRRVSGLLGYDFIAGAVIRIDYQRRTADASRPSAFTPPELATAQMPIRLDEQVPVVSVGVGNSTSTSMIVDTGAGQVPVLFFDNFVKAHPGAVKDEGLGTGYDPDVAYIGGVGGYVHIVPLRLSSFRFAGLEFKHFIVIRAEQGGAFGSFSDDGLLSPGFLKYFTVYLDYPDQRIYFEPNENYTQSTNHR